MRVGAADLSTSTLVSNLSSIAVHCRSSGHGFPMRAFCSFRYSTIHRWRPGLISLLRDSRKVSMHPVQSRKTADLRDHAALPVATIEAPIRARASARRSAGSVARTLILSRMVPPVRITSPA
jgi:hypothetical protein